MFERIEYEERIMPEIINTNFVCPVCAGNLKLIRISKSERISESEYLKGCSNPKCSFGEYYNKQVEKR